MPERARAAARARKSALAAALMAAALALAAGGASASPAAAQSAPAVIHYAGQRVLAPASWPVYRLSAHPQMCVRLDRAAVYLGTPGASQRCPANAIGRRRAILLEPAAARVARASALAAGPTRAAPAATAISGAFTGLGFDACSAPSSRTMAAWSSSPYRALGVYIGGANSACAQPNLTASWVKTELSAGWHPIPLYVGLQAPSTSCGGCAKLSSNQATQQGTAAANDAVEEAASIDIGAGSPIYFDMEAYTPGGSATRATLTFLQAWTQRLHVLGYLSGVYSSSASGIADLASELGTGYTEPDDVWTANWNGEANSADPYLPSDAWVHQRIHQYRGANNETYGRETINVDNDYIDGATVGAAPPPPPTATASVSISSIEAVGEAVSVGVLCERPAGQTCPGQIVMHSNVRIGGRGHGPRMMRVAIAQRGFRLGGGQAHTFRVALNARGRPLLRKAGTLQTQLVVAIPGSRATRSVELTRGSSGAGGL